MFSGEGEFSFRDDWCWKEAQRMLEAGDSEGDQPILSFCISLSLKDSDPPLTLKLFTTYPTEYPSLPPRCHVDFPSNKMCVLTSPSLFHP